MQYHKISNNLIVFILVSHVPLPFLYQRAIFQVRMLSRILEIHYCIWIIKQKVLKFFVDRITWTLRNVHVDSKQGKYFMRGESLATNQKRRKLEWVITVIMTIWSERSWDKVNQDIEGEWCMKMDYYCSFCPNLISFYCVSFPFCEI